MKFSIQDFFSKCGQIRRKFLPKIRKVFTKFKTLFGAPFGLTLAQNLQKKVFPKKSTCWILNFYAAVTLCKKSEKLQALSFHNTWKAFFWVHSGSLFGLETSKQDIFQKLV